MFYHPPPSQGKLSPVCPVESPDTIIQASEYCQESVTAVRGPEPSFLPGNLGVYTGRWWGVDSVISPTLFLSFWPEGLEEVCTIPTVFQDAPWWVQ